ncbi:MAG TPA: hypothetical protein PK420_10120 [Rubrivivax sp.]|jgi:hypothetical protein|nr:hypothetical protein [Rubrivivax sp.]
MKRRTRPASASGSLPSDRLGVPLITLPEHWSPEQALAVFEIVDGLRELLWHRYGGQIQQAMRAQRSTTGPTAQLDIDYGADTPF